MMQVPAGVFAEELLQNPTGKPNEKCRLSLEYVLLRLLKRVFLSPMILALLFAATVGCAPVKDAAYWRDWQIAAQRIGLMRTERAPKDATFTNADLIENFRQINFYDEFILEDGEFRPGHAPRNLEKYEGDVSYSVIGDGVTDQDRVQIKGMVERVSRVTGLSLSNVEPGDSDVRLMILNRLERQQLMLLLREKTQLTALINDLENDLGDNVCVAYPVTGEESRRIHLIVIPDEISGVLRQACIEEEFGQAFGPAADYNQARPSIFNDDQEFALFTVHDELLFRILYDPRLKDGMTEKEAMPIVRRIVEELRPDDGVAAS